MMRIPPPGVMSMGYSILIRRIPGQIPGAAATSGADGTDARRFGFAP
jgi:hypothetical protein